MKDLKVAAVTMECQPGEMDKNLKKVAYYAQEAVEAGAEALSQPQDQFWGVRSAIIKDPFGYRWSFGQEVEAVPPEELMKRAQAYFNPE